MNLVCNDPFSPMKMKLGVYLGSESNIALSYSIGEASMAYRLWTSLLSACSSFDECSMEVIETGNRFHRFAVLGI